MGRYICKVNEGGRDYYFEFSSVVDAPVTFGMSREEFEKYYREEYGNSSMGFEFEDRMKRVEEKGTSSRLHDSAEELLRHNRAGMDETCLTVPQLIDAYCVNTEWAICRTPEEEAQGKPCPIKGITLAQLYGDE